MWSPLFKAYRELKSLVYVMVIICDGLVFLWEHEPGKGSMGLLGICCGKSQPSCR